MGHLELDKGGEIEVGLNRGLPHFLVKRRWGRVETLIDEVVRETELSEAVLWQRARENETFGDLFVEAANRSSRTGDERYRTVLARLIAAACDDAKVDEVGYMLGELLKLEPLHLRVLFSYLKFRDFFDADLDVETALRLGAASVSTLFLTREKGVAKTRLSQGIYENVVRVLSNADLLNAHEAPAGAGTVAGEIASPWTMELLRVVFPSLRANTTPIYD